MTTVISSPNLHDSTDDLFQRWTSIPGNESKTDSDIRAFLSLRSLSRDLFLYENTSVELEHVKANIFLSTHIINN